MRGYSYEFVKRVRAKAKSPHALVGMKLGLRAIERGMSISYIANKVGVSRMAVYDWFTGKYEPNAGNLAKLTAIVDHK
jgi:transcriptional regulator with XRE-family HTH domain